MIRRMVECMRWSYVRVGAWLSVIASIPWVRAWLIMCRRVFTFLVGDRFEDERVTFSKPRLVVNDAYRDRLLAPEIADLVDLWDALQFSIPQRKAFFRCFLHLDYLRRAGVARCELLRYCGLRDTPAARFLLPSNGAFDVMASTHRSESFRTQRWDVVQLLALMYSLCTMEPKALLDLCVEEIIARVDGPENDAFGGRLVWEIEATIAFAYGVPRPAETSLITFLCRIYSNLRLPFPRIHDIKSVGGVVTLFPVLLFPCVWLQRVVQKHVMGKTTWQKLASRRAELILDPSGFASATEIIAAAQTRQAKKPVSTDTNGSLSTPHRVLPVEHAISFDPVRSYPPVAECQNEDDAWRATADSVLATVFVWSQHEATNGAEVSILEASTMFHQTRDHIQTRTMGQRDLATIQRHLIREYGYQFTSQIFAKSSVSEASGDLVRTTSVKQQLRRATQRLRKADDSVPLVEDKATYWKEYTDPLLKRVFYHNIRTGESRWEKPSTLLIKRRKKGKRSPTRSLTMARQFL